MCVSGVTCILILPETQAVAIQTPRPATHMQPLYRNQGSGIDDVTILYTLHGRTGRGIKRVVSSGCGTRLLSVPVSTTTSSPLKESAKRSRLLGAGPSRNSPVTL